MKTTNILLGALAMTLVFSSCGVKKRAFLALANQAATTAVGATGVLIDDEEAPKPKEVAKPKPVEPVKVAEEKKPQVENKTDKLLESASALKGAKVTTVTDKDGQKAVKITLDSSVLFKVGQNNLQPEAQNTLNQFANVVKNSDDSRIAIHGYASSDGSAESNLALSQKRANTVRDYLTGKCNIKSSQIKETVGFGEDPKYLIYDANGVEDKVASRRVEILLYPAK